MNMRIISNNQVKILSFVNCYLYLTARNSSEMPTVTILPESAGRENK